MKELTEAQLKLICDFLNMTAAAWFSAGIITPFFTLKNSSEKITFSLAGITAAFLFFSVALIYAKRMK